MTQARTFYVYSANKMNDPKSTTHNSENPSFLTMSHRQGQKVHEQVETCDVALMSDD